MASPDFVLGDPVWAKMKGYPIWPAKIVDPPSTPTSPKNKKASYVLFFGTGDYAWILNTNIIPHSESVLAEARSRKKPPTNYPNAINELVSYFKTHKKVKQPKIIKKEIIKNNVTKSSPFKVAKAFNSVSNKYNRKVFSKSLPIKTEAQRKSSFCDFNGKSSPSKFPKMINLPPTDFSPVRDLHSPVQQNNSVYKNLKHVNPSPKTLGFIGLGMMGKQLVKKLIESGHDITIWNKTSNQCDKFVAMGAKKACSPTDLAIKCDITFCCVSNPEASKVVFFNEENGWLRGLLQANSLGMSRKGYVEMTGIDHVTSQMISAAVARNHGAYLEAPLCGTSKDAEEENLLILGAGDAILFRECETFFRSFVKDAFYMGCNIGDATKMSLILSTVSGIACAALAESMVMIERLNLQKSDFIECLQNGPLACKNILDKAQDMNDLTFKKKTALKHVQKDLMLTKSIGNAYSQPTPLTAAAHEIYKLGKLMFYSNEDVSAVYKVVKY